MRTKSVRPEKTKFEYLLNISNQFDNLKGLDYILFDFQTTKEFVTYEYIISVIVKHSPEKKNLIFKIEGLSAPIVSFSNSGNAGFQYKLFENPKSDYEITFVNNKRVKNIFTIRLDKDDLRIKKSPSGKFINITIN
ncbi:MAG TPA: hypothetical protein PLG90_06725 [Ignavibacteria bacterium]|nr:hypothetical protein [Ignavibacteria bacterium]